jgi:hypothetical protein
LFHSSLHHLVRILRICGLWICRCRLYLVLAVDVSVFGEIPPNRKASFLLNLLTVLIPLTLRHLGILLKAGSLLEKVRHQRLVGGVDRRPVGLLAVIDALDEIIEEDHN